MLKTLSSRTAETIGSQLQSSEEEIQVYEYGIEIILGTLFQLLLLVILSLLLGILPYTLVTLLAFAGFRIPGGGVHMSSYARCSTIGMLIILAISYFSAHFDPDPPLLLPLLVFVGITALTIIKLWIPMGTEKKIFTDPGIIRNNKLKALVFMFIWIAGTCAFIHFQLCNYAFAFILGAAGALLLINPLGYMLIKRLDYCITSLERR